MVLLAQPQNTMKREEVKFGSLIDFKPGPRTSENNQEEKKVQNTSKLQTSTMRKVEGKQRIGGERIP